jgi:hypothetical protein
MALMARMTSSPLNLRPASWMQPKMEQPLTSRRKSLGLFWHAAGASTLFQGWSPAREAASRPTGAREAGAELLAIIPLYSLPGYTSK